MNDTAALAALYQKTLNEPGNKKLLEELRTIAIAEIPDLSNEALEGLLAVDRIDQVSEDWLATVYSVLAAADPCPALSEGARQAILEANEREEETIGLAFKEALLQGLRPELANLVVVFARVPRVSEKAQRNLRQTPSVDAAWPDCSGIVACGLTPLDVFYATESVMEFATRLQEDRVLPQSDVITLTRRETGDLQTFADYLVSEFMRVTRGGEPAAECLLHWLIAVAREKPLVFGGAQATPEGQKLVLRPDREKRRLFDRWRHSHDEPVVRSEPTMEQATSA